jgi:hypothetical protein
LGHGDISLELDLAVAGGLALFFFVFAAVLIGRGYRLRA